MCIRDSNMGEMMYLQYGNLSNFIMAHYWNIQDELVKYGHLDYDQNAVYIESKESGRFTPRALIFDTKDAYGYYAPYEHDPRDAGEISGESPDVYHNNQVDKSIFLKYLDGDEKIEEEKGEMEDEDELDKLEEELKGEDKKSDLQSKKHGEKIAEDEKVPKEGKEQKSEELKELKELESLNKLYAKFKLEETTKYWIDYSQTCYSSMNRVALPFSKGVEDLSRFQLGVNIAKTQADFRDDYEDKFRIMLERCDLLRGMTLIYEWNNGFSGIASETVTTFKQEVPKCPVLAFAVVNPYIKKKKEHDDALAELNMLMALHELCDQFTNLTLPFDLPEIKFNPHSFLKGVKPDLKYHMSALPALAIEGIVHPLLRKSERKTWDLRSWTSLFAYDPNTKLGHIRSSSPFIRYESEKLEEAIGKFKMEAFEEFSPYILQSKQTPYFSHNFLRANNEGSLVKRESYVENLGNIPNLSKYVKSSFIDENILLPLTFPRFFDNAVTTRGKIAVAPPSSPPFITQIPYYENVYLSSGTSMYIDRLLKNVLSKHLWLKQTLNADKLDIDDWNEIKSKTMGTIDSYHCLLYTSPSPRDATLSRMPSSA
eukprot:TRINITY_DN1047_c0_g1_i2.p1 TRINITY_DN1047_c0_g1~~TRINITY_DN1047_c0_g1_i2.p1  ORF type:complete len:607 (-),score=120.48 TRINITY_DN1047_c0_g1_i2:9-1799(-)